MSCAGAVDRGSGTRGCSGKLGNGDWQITDSHRSKGQSSHQSYVRRAPHSTDLLDTHQLDNDDAAVELPAHSVHGAEPADPEA